MSRAIAMLECATRLLSSTLAGGYTWLVRLHFPMLEYVYVLRHLRGHLSADTFHWAWHVLGEKATRRKPPSRSRPTPSLPSASGSRVLQH